jgi:hypothetical protein
MPDPIIAWFDTLEDAYAWRRDHGGWIYASEAGPAIWFCLRFTPTLILTHPALRGAGSGQLLSTTPA